MKRFSWTRRGLLRAVFAAAAGMMINVGIGSATETLLPIPEEPEITAIRLEQPETASVRDRPVVRRRMAGWTEVEQSVAVTFSTPRKVNGKWETTLTFANDGTESLAGPVRVVIDDLGLEKASVRNPSGRTIEKAPFFEVLSKGKSLEAGKTAADRRVELSGFATLTDKQIEEFSPQYRVFVADKEGLAKKPEESENKFTQADLDLTMSRQSRLDDLLAKSENKDIYGTATSLDDEGRLQITVYSRVENPPGIPGSIDGTPVRVELSAPIYSDVETAGSQAAVNTDSRFPRPVPIGVGIGNESACSFVGTLGCRSTRSGTKYVMSNYHVLVPSKISAVQITQPSGCSNISSNSLGRLALYYPITFSRTASNRYDAAWASTTTSLTGTRPPEGYGKLGSTISPSLGMNVQKFGRTTKFTKGRITAVNVTIFVSYSAGTARFLGTFQVKPQSGYSQFNAPGDSGSLVVKQGTNQPVGLHFAGSSGIGYSCPVNGGMLSRARMAIDTN